MTVEQNFAGRASAVAFETPRHVGLGLQTHEVEGRKPVIEILAFRQGLDVGKRRKGDVQEQADPRRDPEPPQLHGDRQEMIVMHPDGIFGLDDLREHPCNAGVHHGIAFRIPSIERDEIGSVMAHRPKNRIGVSEIELLVLGLGQVEGRLGISFRAFEGLEVLGRGLGEIATRSDPETASFRQQFVDRHHESARRRAACRNAIGQNDQSTGHGDLSVFSSQLLR